MKRTLIAAIAVCLATGSVKADHIWINEFHYDNTGGDVNEFVEVAVRTGSPFLATDYTIRLYNGSNGAVYETVGLEAFTLGTTVPVLGSADSITLYSYDFTAAGKSLQNDVEGITLSLDTAPPGSVIQFLSYEGSFAGTAGPANGVSSMNVGASESGSAANTSIGFVGVGDRASTFSYALITGQTPGAPNVGQTFQASVVPEPASVLFGGALLAAALLPRRRRP